MQYTGLKDKNGKEIYEGDIVRYWQTRVVMSEKGDIGVIDVQGGGFVVKTDHWMKVGDMGIEQRELIYINGLPVEVIGNIYENPELLK